MPDPDNHRLFADRVAGLRSEIQSILESETADGELRYANEGIAFDAGGAWKASIWKRSGGTNLDIECRQAREETWRVMVIPRQPIWPARFLDWPTDGFEAQLRDAVATLRSSDNPEAHSPPIL